MDTEEKGTLSMDTEEKGTLSMDTEEKGTLSMDTGVSSTYMYSHSQYRSCQLHHYGDHC